MLILTRKHGQGVEFRTAAGEVVRIWIDKKSPKLSSSSVKLAIDAPSTVTVDRVEFRDGGLSYPHRESCCRGVCKKGCAK